MQRTRVQVTMIQGYRLRDIFRVLRAIGRLNARLRYATPEEQDRIMSALFSAPGVTEVKGDLSS
jgi:hypothetical protein